MGSSKYRNEVVSKLSRKQQDDKEIVEKVREKVIKWLFPLYNKESIGNVIDSPSLISDGNKEELEKELIFKLFTHYNEYTFLVNIDFEKENHFMEASVKSRMPDAGHKASIPKVLPNGNFSDELWEQLKNCIIKNELVEDVSSDWKFN